VEDHHYEPGPYRRPRQSHGAQSRAIACGYFAGRYGPVVDKGNRNKHDERRYYADQHGKSVQGHAQKAAYVQAVAHYQFQQQQQLDHPCEAREHQSESRERPGQLARQIPIYDFHFPDYSPAARQKQFFSDAIPFALPRRAMKNLTIAKKYITIAAFLKVF
jgi:hypothetical protein